jgi:hypothetical protein
MEIRVDSKQIMPAKEFGLKARSKRPYEVRCEHFSPAPPPPCPTPDPGRGPARIRGFFRHQDD